MQGRQPGVTLLQLPLQVQVQEQVEVEEGEGEVQEGEVQEVQVRLVVTCRPSTIDSRSASLSVFAYALKSRSIV